MKKPTKQTKNPLEAFIWIDSYLRLKSDPGLIDELIKTKGHGSK